MFNRSYKAAAGARSTNLHSYVLILLRGRDKLVESLQRRDLRSLSGADLTGSRRGVALSCNLFTLYNERMATILL